MAYEARKGNNNELSSDNKRARNDRNNANSVKNAANVAAKSNEPHAAAIGKAVKAADNITGGKSSEILGKALTNTNKGMPGVGKLAQGFSNKMAESGTGDKIGKAASMSSGEKGTDGGNNVGGDKKSSLPSFGDKKGGSLFGKKNPFSKKSDLDEKEDSDNFSSISKVKGFISNPIVRLSLPIILPFLFLIILVCIIISAIASEIGIYDDSFVVTASAGENNNGLGTKASSKEQEAFANRVNSIKLEYQANGKFVDVVKIVAVYNVMKKHDKSINYDTMNDTALREIADSMFSGNSYNEEVFKENLKNNIFVKYFPDSTDSKRDSMVKDVISYVGGYNKIVDKSEESTSCADTGECSYDIKGFYIKTKGNLLVNYKLSNLYVRLMQCGGSYGGTWGQSMSNENLIPFEDYVLGAAYAEIGPTYPEAFKAQLVISRSYALTRHIDMKGWHTLKQESDGKWVLQLANCTADQLYCNVDKGCSWDNNKKHLLSGNGGSSQYKPALSADSSYRKYLDETEGELLVNSQGNVIYAAFNSSFQKKIIELAKSGLTYKQILLQVYNQGDYNFGAANIKKAACERTSNCISNGEYSQWRQDQGEWINVPLGNSGMTISNAGCLVTSLAIQIARSGVPTNINGKFTPGTFVEFLNKNGAFSKGGGLNMYSYATLAAPSFKYVNVINVLGLSKNDKLNTIKNLVNQKNTYVVAEVYGNIGQHWVAIDSVTGDTINMMDPGTNFTDMWGCGKYEWENTSKLVYFVVE